MTTHAILSPSSYSRWSQCPAAPRLESQAPPDKSSAAAQRGTNGHANAEAMLRGADASSLTWDDARQREDVSTYVLYVQEQSYGLNSLEIEVKLPLQWLTGEEGAHGTADAIIVGPGRLEVVDLKLGRHPVEARANGQLMMYLAAAVRKYGAADRELRITICQPGTGFAYNTYVVEYDELMQFIDRVQAAAKRTRLPSAQPRPSDAACQWCRAKAFCPALRQQAASAVAMAFADDLTGALDLVPRVEAWAKAVKEAAIARLVGGETVDGYELTAPRRKPAKWANSQAAAEFLKNNAVDMELPTVASVKRAHVEIPEHLLAPEEFAEPGLKKI